MAQAFEASTATTEPTQPGQRFGRLTVIDEAPRNKSGRRMWRLRCDCGKKVQVPSGNLRSGNTKSCGCLRNEVTMLRSTVHGMTGSPEYRSWQHMLERCYNHNSNDYHRYGGRGIAVFKRWRYSFVAFYEDMGPRPSPRHSIERIDNNGPYWKENCRWATPKEQSRNTRRNRMVTLNGRAMPLIEACEMNGITYNAVKLRLRNGWTLERAISEPPRKTAAGRRMS